MYSHYPTNWWEMSREGENFIWFINPTNWWDMIEIIDADSHDSLDDMRCLQPELNQF